MNPVHVLLAGDKDYAPYLLEGRNTCLVEFPTGKLLDLTLSAFAAAREVKTLLIVGPEILAPRVDFRALGKSASFLSQQGSFSQNVHAALLWVKQNHPGSRAIFVTNDAPLLTSRELDDFASAVSHCEADINVAVSRIEPATLRDPLVREYIRSIVTLSDGLFLLANQVSLSVSSIDLLETLQEVFDLRKQSQYGTSLRTFLYVLKKWGDVRSVALWLRVVFAKKIWLFQPKSIVASQLSISLKEVESSLGHLIGQKLRVRLTELPQALGCFDADTPQQLDELRVVIASHIELQSKLEAAHA